MVPALIFGTTKLTMRYGIMHEFSQGDILLVPLPFTDFNEITDSVKNAILDIMDEI